MVASRPDLRFHDLSAQGLRQDKVRTLCAGARQRYADLLNRLGQ